MSQATSTELSRHLAAVMFTDMEGYTALMQRDAAAALRSRQRHRTALERSVQMYDGEVLQYFGSGRGRFVTEPIRLNEFVDEMAHLLEVSISKKAVLTYNFADDLATFDGDATQIRQIIMNLITNASEAIGDKSGVISLSTGTMNCDRAYLDELNLVLNHALRANLDEPMPQGAYVYLEVGDTGCGMYAETI